MFEQRTYARSDVSEVMRLFYLSGAGKIQSHRRDLIMLFPNRTKYFRVAKPTFESSQRESCLRESNSLQQLSSLVWLNLQNGSFLINISHTISFFLLLCFSFVLVFFLFLAFYLHKTSTGNLQIKSDDYPIISVISFKA